MGVWWLMGGSSPATWTPVKSNRLEGQWNLVKRFTTGSFTRIPTRKVMIGDGVLPKVSYQYLSMGQKTNARQRKGFDRSGGGKFR